jgi:hypothetical protein
MRSGHVAGLCIFLLAGVAFAADDVKKFKPAKPGPPQEVHPTRDPAPIANAIDREIDRLLSASMIPASPRSDDGEFLRRVSLDVAGRIPTWERAAHFIDDSDPDKRRKLIDALLASLEFGQRQADVWRPLLAPRDPANTKPQVDRFSPWLAEQFNRNRGWDKITAELVGMTGDVKDRPDSSFLMANAENAQPKANLVAASLGTTFLGIQLQCAECHDHPFAPWKQEDFWGIAAFFGKTRNSGTKGPPWILTEDPDPKPLDVKNGGVARPVMRAGGQIVIPATGGNKGAGAIVAAKLLGGKSMTLDDESAFRPRIIEWLTAKDNPYFAKAFVNRVWASLFGRGLVYPLDQMHANNAPSHPEVLDLLAKEFIASEFDVKHLFRCICLTEAYQRSSRPVEGNTANVKLLSRMAVKPIGPESLYDSLLVVYSGSKSLPTKGKPEGSKPMKPQPGAKPMGPVNPRDEFIHFFRGQGGAEPGEFAHGIPQFLRRMNGDEFNQPGPMIQRLVDTCAATDKVIEALFLATLTRRPSADERALMNKYIASRPTPSEGYAGALWVLLNSGEFVLNR